MRSPVLTAEPGMSLRRASEVLRDAHVGTLVVIDGDAVAGILSERDLVRAVADRADLDTVRVREVMSEGPRYLTVGEPVEEARHVMVAAGIRHLPVFDEGELVGIVSIRDVLEPGAHL